MDKEMDLPCNCWEGYICEHCKIREKVKEKLSDKYGVFNNYLEQNADQFVSDAINFTIQESSNVQDTNNSPNLNKESSE
jgi:hypothetical protein